MSKIFNDFNFYINPQIKKEKSNKSLKDNKKKISKDQKSDFNKILEEQLEVDEINKASDELKSDEKKIEVLLKEIGLQGEKLKKNQIMAELDKYKKLVKEYIFNALNYIEYIENVTLWDKNKKQKITKTHIKVINNEIMELTRLFFSQQQNVLAIAAKIDIIEGLLINYLT